MSQKYMTLIELTVALSILAVLATLAINYAIDSANSAQDERARHEMLQISRVISGTAYADQTSAFFADHGYNPSTISALYEKTSVEPTQTALGDIMRQWNGPYIGFYPQFEYVLDYQADTAAIYMKKSPQKLIQWLQPRATLVLDFKIEDFTFSAKELHSPALYQTPSGLPWIQQNYNVNDSCVMANGVFKCVGVNYNVDSTACVEPPFMIDYGRTFDDGRHLWQNIYPPTHALRKDDLNIVISTPGATIERGFSEAKISNLIPDKILLEVSNSQLSSGILRLRLHPGVNTQTIYLRKKELLP